MKRLALPLFSALLPVFLAASCSPPDNNSTTQATSGTGAATSGSGTAGQGGMSSTSGTGAMGGQGGEGGFSFTTGASSGNGGAGGAGGGCVGTSEKATLVPLDMYIMLDSSGSMLDKTGTMGQGVPKWDAVKSAFTAFFQDPGSAGMGVGLQYFPLTHPNAPSSCTSQAECGQFGPCMLKICSDGSAICTSNQQCPNGTTCTDLGQCKNDPATFCLPIGGFCNGNKGQCVKVSTSQCQNTTSCEAIHYATPAVDIALLPGAAPGLVASMNAKAPVGGTPTSAALTGAIDQAKAYATANPTHKVVAVLATDGLPTQCDPLDFNGISAIAKAGLDGTPSIPTFVIGVFAGNDANAKMNLDQLAAAGGTTQAFIVDVNQNVEQAFLAALNAIRGQKLACEYLIPAPPPGETLDYGQVNVRHTPMGANMAKTIYYVGSVDKCDAVTGGWYYDVDPASGGTPTKIVVCPATCAEFGTGGQIDIALGCKTELPPPK